MLMRSVSLALSPSDRKVFELSIQHLKTTADWQGMFLFARLAMNHLFDQTNPESLRTETSFLIGTFGPDDAAGQGAAGVFKNLYVV